MRNRNKPEREATVVMAKCQRQKRPFGIRTERINNVWTCTWTFELSEKAASNEGYDQVNISGQMGLDENYPGCPYCGAGGWFKCGKCGKLTCHSGESVVTCAWCGNKGECTTSDTFDLSGSGY